MLLEEWQNRLNDHFIELSKKKGDFKLFAFEHNLSAEELVDLKNSLRISESNYLPWVIHTTEIGYTFRGREFWDPFKEKTINWHDSIENRNFIRNCFDKFEKSFNTISLKGSWANTFNIISHPIIHSIIPLDLQLELIKTVHNIRYLISDSTLASFELLGNLIKENSNKQNSKFSFYFSQTSLIGQFVHALFIQDRHNTGEMIYEPALKRIIDDLENHEKKKIFWQDIKEIKEKINIVPTIHKSKESTEQIDHIPQIEKLFLRPEIRLIKSDDAWDVFLVLPAFQKLYNYSPKFRELLNKAKVRINHSESVDTFAINLVHSKYRFKLIKWPKLEESLIDFIVNNKKIYSINFSDLVDNSNNFLFKINDYNEGILDLSNIIDYNSNYILLNDGENSNENGIKINCKDIRGITLYKNDFQSINQYGYFFSNHILLKPILFPYLISAEIGLYTYFVDNTPTFLISTSNLSDNSFIENFTILCNNNNIYSFKNNLLSNSNNKEYVFQIFDLEPGFYNIIVRAEINNEGIIYRPKGSFRLNIVENNSFLNNISSPLQIYSTPYNPSLDELWDKKCIIKVLGPIGYKVKPQIIFFNDDNEILVSKTFNNVEIPIDTNSWDSLLDKIKDDADLIKYYDKAHKGSVIFYEQNLGKCKIDLIREIRPLQWIIKENNKVYYLKLLNDLSDNSTIELFYLSFNKPFDKVKILNNDKYEYEDIIKDEGLYYAKTNDKETGIILSSMKKSLDFHEFKERLPQKIEIPKFSLNVESLNNILELISIWSNANTTGNIISNIMRQKIYDSFCYKLYELLLTVAWVYEEKNIKDTEGLLKVFSMIKDKHLKEKFTDKYQNELSNFHLLCYSDKSDSLNNIFRKIGTLYAYNNYKNICDRNLQEEFVRFCLDVANAPQNIFIQKRFSKDRIKEFLEILIKHRNFLEITRILTIHTRVKNNISNKLYWGWPCE